MVCFDASVLIDLFNPRLAMAQQQRIELMMQRVGKEKIVIPAPAYTEIMVRADKAREAYDLRMSVGSQMRVEAFSKRAAFECAIILEGALTRGERGKVSKTKVKFDWMIVATAKVLNATHVYTCDGDIVRACQAVDLPCTNVNEIVIPPQVPKTGDLFIEVASPADASPKIAALTKALSADKPAA